MTALRLTRNESNKKIAGVCAGLADYLDVDPVIVRLAFVFLTFASGIGLPLYFILALITPKKSIEEDIHINPHRDEFTDSALLKAKEKKRRTIIASFLVFTGAMFIMGNFGVNLGMVIPITLIILGVTLLVNRRKTY